MEREISPLENMGNKVSIYLFALQGFISQITALLPLLYLFNQKYNEEAVIKKYK
jgi:hypothetical protein